ncbi:hypothetical protein J5Y04_11030 [Kitasatospora sp. RG8]|uniref:hypothetical protein n=1 Tax=Kitasatospora sp. RG8 TaxID=2820815 RepID=UPI001ADED8C0|nr:hypothetical protein [Kitasatospora sp. RG8]MBP0450080.1 hypothetical protein [Kitasatospora sp. RG8]
MKLRTTVHRVRTGRDEYRVVSATAGEGLAVLYDGPWEMQLYADRAGARDLAAAWALAARSPRSLIHLPLRADAGSPGLEGQEAVPLDLVLLHHSLGFPPSRWKEVRARLGRGVPHTADIPESDFPAEDEIDHERRHFAGWRDELHFAGAARTLFLTGSAEAFRRTGTLVRSLDTEAAAVMARWPNRSHYCVTLTHGSGNRPGRAPKGGVPGQLHIEYVQER